MLITTLILSLELLVIVALLASMLLTSPAHTGYKVIGTLEGLLMLLEGRVRFVGAGVKQRVQVVRLGAIRLSRKVVSRVYTSRAVRADRRTLKRSSETLHLLSVVAKFEMGVLEMDAKRMQNVRVKGSRMRSRVRATLEVSSEEKVKIERVFPYLLPSSRVSGLMGVEYAGLGAVTGVSMGVLRG